MYVGPTGYGFPPKMSLAEEQVGQLERLHHRGLITLNQLRESLPEGTLCTPAERAQSPLTRELSPRSRKPMDHLPPAVSPVLPDPKEQAARHWEEAVRQVKAASRYLDQGTAKEQRHKKEYEQCLRDLENRTRSSQLLTEKDGQEHKSLPEDWNVTDSKRVGDQERWKVNDLLTRYFEEGYLTRDEFEARMTSVIAAKTKAELKGIFSDLPELEAKPVVGGVQVTDGTYRRADGSILMASSEGQLQRRVQHWTTYAVLIAAIVNVIYAIVMGVLGHAWEFNIAVSAFAFTVAKLTWKSPKQG
jgi:hypothetical protein